jgi:REP element-mobilizing transposase RayT
MILGHIKNGKAVLIDSGIIACREWIKTAQIRTYVDIDAFIIMPNHIHGIIVIKGYNYALCRGMGLNSHYPQS